MSEPNDFLRDARKSFRLASEANGPNEIERYAAMGHDYLQLAHAAAKVEQPQSHTQPPSLWRPL